MKEFTISDVETAAVLLHKHLRSFSGRCLDIDVLSNRPVYWLPNGVAKYKTPINMVESINKIVGLYKDDGDELNAFIVSGKRRDGVEFKIELGDGLPKSDSGKDTIYVIITTEDIVSNLFFRVPEGDRNDPSTWAYIVHAITMVVLYQ